MTNNINILIFIFLITISKSNKTPIFVFELFRHGARGPMTLDKSSKDTYGHKWSAPQELTLIGKRMHYISGFRNHERFIDNMTFLSKTFNPREIYLISSDLNRTIESGISHLLGLYPPDDIYAETLNEEQQKFSNPPIILSEKINIEINKLNNQNSPLPQFISTIPFHIYNDIDKRFNIYDSPDCIETVNIIKEKNLNLEKIKNIENEFEKNYKDSFNAFLKQKGNYSFPIITTMCDQFISDYIDGRDLNDLTNYNINIDNFYEFCGRVADTDFQYYIFGDEKKQINEMSMSPMLSEMLVYLKNRVYADLYNVTIDKNLNDFSKPKYIMVSGHDITICGIEIFINDAFGKNYSYIRPKFASSLFLEVYKKEHPLSYDDYEVHYIINDEIVDIFKLSDFITNIEKKIWMKSQILEFCKMNIKGKDYRILVIVILSILCFLLIFALIFLIIQTRKKNDIKFLKENYFGVK